MPVSFARPLNTLLGCLVFTLSLLVVPAVRAELVWSAATGWRVEGGLLSGLAGPAAGQALDQMNRARNDEEAGRTRSAIKTYASVSRRYPNSVYAPEAIYRAARLHLIRKEYSKSFDAYQAVLTRYPNSKRFN